MGTAYLSLLPSCLDLFVLSMETICKTSFCVHASQILAV